MILVVEAGAVFLLLVSLLVWIAVSFVVVVVTCVDSAVVVPLDVFRCCFVYSFGGSFLFSMYLSTLVFWIERDFIFFSWRLRWYFICVLFLFFLVGPFEGKLLQSDRVIYNSKKMQPPALYHHQRLFRGIDGIRNALESFPVLAYAKHVVSVCRPGGNAKLRHFYFSAAAQEWGHYISCEVGWDVAYCHLDSTCTHIFGLQPEELCFTAVRQFCCLFFCSQLDIPCCEASSTEILCRDACCL